MNLKIFKRFLNGFGVVLLIIFFVFLVEIGQSNFDYSENLLSEFYLFQKNLNFEVFSRENVIDFQLDAVDQSKNDEQNAQLDWGSLAIHDDQANLEEMITQILNKTIVNDQEKQNVTQYESSLSSWCQPYQQYKLPLDNGRLAGVVVPHHDLALKMLDPIMEHLQGQPPKHIILLSPQHFNDDQPKITTLDPKITSVYHTQLNFELIDQLKKLPTLQLNTFQTIMDHGWTILHPIFKKISPQTITPFLFSKRLSQEEVLSFVKSLSSELSENTLVILSADFSHDLLSKEAYEHDLHTIELIKSNNYAKIRALDSTYIDAPTALLAFLMFMNQSHNQITLLKHAHAGQFTDDCNQPTTTYQIWVVAEK